MKYLAYNWMVYIFMIFCMIGFANQAQSQTSTFTIGQDDFLLNGKPFQIISGEMHPSRIPAAYWKDRILKAKAMGLNTISIYVMWNALEPQKDQWDFDGRNDIRRFIRLAADEGLYVIVRPGPYVCAEWEFGGFPWWLLKNKDIKVRTDDPEFMAASKAYLMRLGKEIGDLQITKGGPVIMVQVENEYGSFGDDKVYEAQVEQMLKDAGFDVPYFTADGDWLFQNAVLPGVVPGANGETNPKKLKEAVNKYNNGHGPYIVPELYPGWLDHWGEKYQTVSTKKIVDDTKRLLDAGVSINYYVLHGGTNFDFMNGANYNDDHPIQPDLTSYDYDAPIAESGAITEKYKALRELLSHYQPAGTTLPNIPEATNVITIPNITFDKSASLFDLLPKPVKNEIPLSFEDLNQGYGYVLYRTTFENSGTATLTINGLRDYAQVFINGERVGVLNRMYREKELEITARQGDRLDILVENLGRINFGRELVNNRKGIIGDVTFDGHVLTGWEMYSFPFKNVQNIHFKKGVQSVGTPGIYQGTFDVQKVGDTFLDMSLWGKGIVIVNGHNLGKYWEIGPQQTLYLPGAWLKKGENSIVVFEQLKDEVQELRGIDHPILEDLRK